MYLFKLTFTHASARCLELFSHLVDLPAIFWFYVTTKLKTKHICVRQVKQFCSHGFLRIFNIHLSVSGATLCVSTTAQPSVFFPYKILQVLIL